MCGSALVDQKAMHGPAGPLLKIGNLRRADAIISVAGARWNPPQGQTLRALTVIPGQANSITLDEREAPSGEGALLVRTRALGICGTDREIISGAYGQAPHGAQRLVIGHESLGQVIEAPAGDGFMPGDLVVGIVRRPDPVPCPACAAGEWDMCRNGQYTERGIKARDGYGAEQFRLEPDFAVKVDPALGDLGVLVEPASVVAKAWDYIERLGRRASFWRPKRALITGAGPVGLLAALMAVQRGLDTHMFDRARDGAKPRLTRELGATYHTGDFPRVEPDIVVECTGAAPVVLAAIERTIPGGITCLAGLSSGAHLIHLDLAEINKNIVLENDVVFGTVNANRAHYRTAVDALTRADKDWLARLITRRVPLARWREAFEKRAGDIKVIVDFTS
jgi:threonine dehydrogenase-like Zn-dependent dehydrogenase